MCKNNPLCTSQDDACQCKGGPSAFRSLPSHSQSFAFSGQPMQLSDMQLFELLRQQIELVKMIAQQNSQYIATLASIADRLEKSDQQESDSESSLSRAGTMEPVHDGCPSQEDLLLALSEQNHYDHELKLRGEVANPAYKDRAFGLDLELTTEPPEGCEFKVLLFTTENPPKLIEKNTGGDKVMKGYTDCEVQGCRVLFPKLVVKEVTSHYRNGCVFLVVVCSSGLSVKPLVIEKFVVKARKITAEPVLKRAKTEDASVKSEEAKSVSEQANLL